MPPNSTARVIVNKTLLSLGYMSIATDELYAKGIVDEFGDIKAGLDKYQQQAVTNLDMFHQELALVCNKPFMTKSFQLTTVANKADYVLNQAIIEGLKPNSFFNITAGGIGNGITVISYEKYMQSYARPDTVPVGVPWMLVPLPNKDDDLTQIKLVPTPDQAYVIEGSCRHVVPPIKSGSDRVSFPYRYEQALIKKLEEVLETKVNEGREHSARAYAEQFVAEMMRDATGASEEIQPVDLGFRLYRGGNRNSTRDYNPLTDTVPPYP